MTRRVRCSPCLLATALLLAVASRVALAQETREHDFPDLDRELGVLDVVKVRFTLLNRFVGSADFGSFDANSYQPEARLKISIPVTNSAALRLLGTGRVLIYDFDGVTDLFETGTAFDDLDSWTLRIQGAYLLDEGWTLFSDSERWSLLLEGFAKARWEKGSRLSDGLTAGGSLALGYKLGERLEVAAGLSVGTRLLGDGVGVTPLVEFDWRIDDQWTLRSFGVGLQLERQLTERLVLFVRGRLESRSYRLDDRGGTIGRGSIRVRQLPAGVGFRWNLTPHLRLTAAVGAVAYHQLRVKTTDRDVIGSRTADPSAYLTVRFDVRP